MKRQHVPHDQCERRYSSSSSVQRLSMPCIEEARLNVGLLQLFWLAIFSILWSTFLRRWNIRKWIQGILLSICLFGASFSQWLYEPTGSGRYA